MKKHLLPFILFLFLIQDALVAQPMDFDSLYLHDANFKQAVVARQEYHNLFDSDEVLHITIVSDFKNLIKRKYKGEYQPAIFKYFLNDTIVATREIKIKPRGNMRRSTCYFPPIMLNFDKDEAILEQLKEFDKIKMVMDCRRGNTYEQYLLSEYYAYKLYNYITDCSFRARLFEVTLLDVNDKVKPMTSYAFIIENIDQLAERLDAIPFETKNVRDQLTDPTALANGYLFQYLVGNTDWSIPGMHNIKLIKPKDPLKPSPSFIPYDFDYAGIVNTNYAVPDERLGIASVRQRVYRGVCIDEKHLKDAAQRFITNKDNLYALYQSSPYIDKHNLKSTIDYLDEFYMIIESENSFRRYILEQCR